MNFTGERVIPGEVDADLFNEHWARYLFAAGFASGKKVLDVACGSGYGSALLAETAAHVISADIAHDAVDYARRHYASPKTHFVQADCFSLPFGPARFDLVVALEIIEHIGDAVAFLEELRRVLAPDGLLLISTPNRLYYTEDRGEVNPFHEREYSYPEFSELLRGVFPHCAMLLENHVAGLLLSDSAQAVNLTKSNPSLHQQDGEENSSEPRHREQEAFFIVAICSGRALPATRPFLYLPSSGNVLRERETHIRHLEEHLAEARSQVRRLTAELEDRTRWAQETDRRLAEKNACVLQLQSQYDSDVGKARADLAKLQQEFEERTAWALKLNRELEFLYSTRWYRMGRKFGVKLDPPAIPPNVAGQTE